MENRELERYLEEELIPRYVDLKKKGNDVVPYIQLNKLNRLNLPEDELQSVMDYLSKRGIRVSGRDPVLEGEFENYDSRRAFSNFISPKALKPEETLEKFKVLDITKDPVVREQIILGNLRLASYFALDMANLYGTSREELEEYAFEGLIYAVDTFDLSKGVRFSTHAYQYICGHIMDGIYENENFKRGEYKIFSAIREIEDINKQTINENPDLVDDVVDLLIEKEQIHPKNAFNNRRRIMMLKHFSLDDLSVNDMKQAENNNITSRNIYPETPEEIALDKLSKESIKDFFSKIDLKDNEREVLRLYCEDGKNLSEIGEILGVTRQRVHQIKSDALRKMRDFASNPEVQRKMEDIFPKERTK